MLGGMGHGKFSELAPAAMAQNSCSFLWQTSRLTVFGNGKSPRTEAGQEQQPELLNYLIEGLDTFSFVCIFFLLWLYFIFALCFSFRPCWIISNTRLLVYKLPKTWRTPSMAFTMGPQWQQQRRLGQLAAAAVMRRAAAAAVASERGARPSRH